MAELLFPLDEAKYLQLVCICIDCVVMGIRGEVVTDGDSQICGSLVMLSKVFLNRIVEIKWT